MYQRILVPFDGSPTSTQGLDEAIRLARVTGATLRVLHAINELTYATGFESYAAYAGDVIPLLKEGGEKIVEQGRSRVAAAGIPVETRLVENFSERLADIVVDEARGWNADLIVIGTHGRRGVERLVLGSDAELILRTAPVPVLLVRAPEAVAQPRGG